MSEINQRDGGPAFPAFESDDTGKVLRYSEGMSLRAYIAAQVLAQQIFRGGCCEDAADLAIKAADALIERLGR